METIERIIKDYRRADNDQQLHMYLDHRDLRPLFDEIDRRNRGICADAADSSSLREMAREIGRGIKERLSTCRSWCLNKSL